MGRYSAKKRQEEQAKARKQRKQKALEYTTGRSRGGQGNRRLVRSPKPTPTKTIPAKDRPKDMQAGTVYGDAGQPKAPKLPPKPSATKATPPKAKPSTKVSTPKKTVPKKTTPKKPAATSSKKLTPMQQWAKANPKLAAKVKKGQSGYKELKIGRSTKKRDWLDKNYKPGK